MAGKSNFKWEQAHSERVTKTNRKIVKSKKQALQKELYEYNHKIDTLLSEGYSKGALPKKKTLNELKKKITTQADYKRELAEITRFKRKNATDVFKNEHGAEITRYKLNEIMRYTSRVNKDIKKQKEWYDSLPVTVKGKKQQDLTNRDIQQTDKYRYEEKKFDFEKKNKRDIEKYFEMVDGMLEKNYRTRTDETWIKNYMTGTLNKTADEDREYIKKLMSKLTTKQIIEIFYSDRNAKINVYYDPYEDYTEMVDSVKETWENAVFKFTGEKLGHLKELEEQAEE